VVTNCFAVVAVPADAAPLPVVVLPIEARELPVCWSICWPLWSWLLWVLLLDLALLDAGLFSAPAASGIAARASVEPRARNVCFTFIGISCAFVFSVCLV